MAKTPPADSAAGMPRRRFLQTAGAGMAALPMVGGMITTTILTLIVIPVVYTMWEGRQYRN
ncbi:MAG: hypothetical protein ACPGQD_04160, partial [Planctomycetota bacterium]